MKIALALITSAATRFFVLAFSRIDRRLLQRRFDAWKAEELTCLAAERDALLRDSDLCENWCCQRIKEDFGARGLANSGLLDRTIEECKRDHKCQRDAVKTSFERWKSYLENTGP